jgi:hypothetical protein
MRMSSVSAKTEADQGLCPIPRMVSKLLRISAVFDDQFHNPINGQT